MLHQNITNHSHFIDFAFRDSFTEIWKVKVLSSAECVPSVTRVLCGCPAGARRAIAARDRGGRPHYIGQRSGLEMRQSKYLMLTHIRWFYKTSLTIPLFSTTF